MFTRVKKCLQRLLLTSQSYLNLAIFVPKKKTTKKNNKSKIISKIIRQQKKHKRVKWTNHTQKKQHIINHNKLSIYSAKQCQIQKIINNDNSSCKRNIHGIRIKKKVHHAVVIIFIISYFALSNVFNNPKKILIKIIKKYEGNEFCVIGMTMMKMLR